MRIGSRHIYFQQKQRSYAEVVSNKVQFVSKNNDQNNNNHPKEKLSQRLRNNTRRNEAESQTNRTPIPKNPTAASGNGGLDMVMLNTVFQGLSQTAKAIAELENNFKTLLAHCQTRMEQ